ncbi:MAG: hypothetical protein ACREQA_22410, partial [Candidatus Binatia bacterium]
MVNSLNAEGPTILIFISWNTSSRLPPYGPKRGRGQLEVAYKLESTLALHKMLLFGEVRRLSKPLGNATAHHGR